MTYTRRDLAKLGLAALPAAKLLAKPNSNIDGVQIGINAPYSFRGAAESADEVLAAMIELGLSAVELRSQPVEAALGAPIPPPGRPRPRPSADGNAADPPPRPRGKRAPPTPEEIAARRAAAEELRKWRLAASLDGFKAFGKKWEDVGVKIDIVKFDNVNSMADDEIDYAFLMAKAVGARFITCEPPLSETKRIGAFADKHKLMVGYHGHANTTDPEAFGAPHSWERSMTFSSYNGANVDIGHFIAGNGVSPAEFIKKHHARITNLHIKDRKRNAGPNVPWGQGDTPIKEILQLVKREKYKFMATIEMEHPIPESSSVMAELAKCVKYCREALA